jgi:hypothetical protein
MPESSSFRNFGTRELKIGPGELVQCLAMPGSARENSPGLSWGIVPTQEAVKLPQSLRVFPHAAHRSGRRR